MKDLQQALAEIIAPWQDIPGAAVCIIQANQPPIFAFSGYASLEYGLRIDANTRFNLASVSKQFTGFAARLLEKRGLLSLDDPLQKFLPEWPDTYREIRIHHLLHHTSGLRDMYNLQAYAGFRRDDVHTREQLLALTLRQGQLNFLPGERYVYNNTGFILLAEIVQRLTGLDMRHFLEAEIFAPLGMSSTFLCNDHKEMIPGFAGHYNLQENGQYVKAFENVSVGGSTNIITSITDFARWLGNYVTPSVEPDVMRGLDLIHPFNDGSPNMYACGLELWQRGGRRIWEHGGGAGGFRTEMLFVPDAGVAVGVLSNNGSMDAATLGGKLLGLLLPELGPQAQASARDRRAAAFSEAERKDLPGYYRLPDGLLVKVEASENRLFILTPFYPVRLELVKTGEKRYRIEILNADMEAETDEHGKVCAFTSTSPLGAMRSVKIPPMKMDEAGLAEYTGLYWNEELLNMWEVGVSQGRLTFFHPHFPQISFDPVLKDEFSSQTEYFDKLKFIRGSDDQVIAFELSGDRAFDIRFRRVKEIACAPGSGWPA
jgi:CubicO group peptidase (beta-lactamase class C family)